MTENENCKTREEIREAAIDWYVQLQDGDLSTSDLERFEIWLYEFEEHQTEFDRVCDSMEQMAELDLETANALLPSQAERPSFHSRTLHVFETMMAPQFAKPALISLFAVFLAVGFIVQFKPVDGIPYETARGEQKAVTLTDGSVVHLNTSTYLLADFSPEERRIVLQEGEAYFEVAKDEGRPFIVQVPDRLVQAVGTAFNIQLDEESATITVAEGVIQILETDGSPQDLQPSKSIPVLHVGQQIVVGNDLEAEHIRRAKPEIVSAWVNGQIIFQDEPLGEVVEEFSRYSRHWFIFWDSSVKEMRVSGTFNPNDIESLNAALEVALPLEATTLASSVTMLSQKSQD